VDQTPIRRLHTGTLWAEGPAWNGVGRYLVWSDAPNNVQMRYIEDDARVTVFRNPSGNSNGNTFDYEGRQLSCEHGNRRVVRYEQNGTVTEIAAKFEGKRLNSPNDIVVHPTAASGSPIRSTAFATTTKATNPNPRSNPASIVSTSNPASSR
jgi:gluconolactonase